MSYAPGRLVTSPVFILSPVRAGSTLLRVLLNSHSQICAPPEMHLQTVQVRFTEFYTAPAVEALGLDKPELEHLLWDRLLHRELVRSGKQVIVDKTPGNAIGWRRLGQAWPEARYIFLIRHPANILASMNSAPHGLSPEHKESALLAYIDGIDQARRHLRGPTVRYEQLSADPVGTTRAMCDFIGVPWEAEMLRYGEQDHGAFQPFIGDYADKIGSGRVQAPRAAPDPAAVPARLLDACRAWGYVS
jgi:hypothetical protein